MSLGYKVTRTTVVLAANSAAYKQVRQVAKDAIAQVRFHNFDLARVPDDVLEIIFADFDEERMKHVVEEYLFTPGIGSIEDLGATCGICDLCGKGDSRDDGENQDKLRYRFRLTNTAGGNDVWCGHNCIVKHGLRVDGAATAEEAQRILERSMRQHMALWKIEAWQRDNPHHTRIPEDFQRLQFFARHLSGIAWDWRANEALGLSTYDLRKTLQRLVRKFRTASRFYERRAHLTEMKEAPWIETMKLLHTLEWVREVYIQAANASKEQRLAVFTAAKLARENKLVRRARIE